MSIVQLKIAYYVTINANSIRQLTQFVVWKIQHFLSFNFQVNNIFGYQIDIRQFKTFKWLFWQTYSQVQRSHHSNDMQLTQLDEQTKIVALRSGNP